jgi:tetratricopeptide (TPR) repeat protein
VTPRSEQVPIARLEARAAADGAALAEAQRRAGRPAEAERLARSGLARDPRSPRLRIALALALLDQRRADAAREELERALSAASELPAELSEQELEAAFERAEPEAEQMIDADRVAEQALREAELGPADEISPRGAADSPFATRTMAELLERQGDRAGAQRIRSRLERTREAPADAGAKDPRGRVVRELERWLANLRMEA